MIDADAIAGQLFAKLFDPVNGYVVSGDQRIPDRDVPRLLCMSSRQARELREEGAAWPRWAVPIAGCRYSVFVRALAEWIAGRAAKTSQSGTERRG